MSSWACRSLLGVCFFCHRLHRLHRFFVIPQLSCWAESKATRQKFFFFTQISRIVKIKNICHYIIVILSLSKATRQKFFLFSRGFQGFQGFQGFLYLLFHYCHPERSRRLLGRSFFSFHTDFKDSKVFCICNSTIVKLSLSKPYENETKSIQSACNYSQRNHKLVKLLSIHSICVPITTTIKSPNPQSPSHQIPSFIIPQLSSWAESKAIGMKF